MSESKMEDAAERAYWDFDSERKRTGVERDAFKGELRKAWRTGRESLGADATVTVLIDAPTTEKLIRSPELTTKLQKAIQGVLNQDVFVVGWCDEGVVSDCKAAKAPAPTGWAGLSPESRDNITAKAQEVLREYAPGSKLSHIQYQKCTFEVFVLGLDGRSTLVTNEMGNALSVRAGIIVSDA